MARETRLSSKTVAVWLALFFLLGLGLRVGMNVGPSFDEDSERFLYSGNDPYYHDRVTRHITETGESMVFDEAINYPAGAYNPNPPMFDWTTAMVAGIYDTVGVKDAPGAALNSMVALWGALTIFPVYVIATALWNRSAGLWASGLMAVSAPHIQRGVWGFADHDATTMFFITLAMAFLVKGLQALDHREYVKDWRHGNALIAGMKSAFAHNKTAMLWSALAGVALTSTALTWKGYPYVLAVMAVAVGFQLLWDHVKNRDSTAVWAFFLLPMVMVTLLPLPYYMAYPVFLDTTIVAGLYVLIGVILVGAILVPTRDLPSILVFPALALAGIVGILVMLFVFPTVGETVFTGLGYFKQSKLFTTIAEAQRSELGRVAASFGFFTFLLAFWGFGRGVKKAWKGDMAHMLMASWALVAGFMAFAASRFIMNAAPVFAILCGGVIVSLVSALGLGEVRKRFRRAHGQNQVGAAVKSLDLRSAGGAVLLALFIILPNVWLGVDAATPAEVDAGKDHMGAFGIDFDVKDNGWLEVFSHLATLDSDLPLEQRPAFMAWWDYGHWATDLGLHPTVADPFQNHYEVAGRTLSAESEQEAVGWLMLLIANTDYLKNGNQYSPAVRDALNAVNPALLEIGPARGRDAEMEILNASVDMTGDDVFKLYDSIMTASGKRIEYLGVDARMYPFSANNPGIFYAPSFLGNKNPDDFVAYRYVGNNGGLTLDVHQYAVDKNGNSYRLAEPRIVSADGREYEVVGGQAYPKGAAISQANPGVAVQFSATPTTAFFNTLYAKAFGNTQTGFAAGNGLSHFRAIAEGGVSNDFALVKLLQYYQGVEVSGRVMDDSGAPLGGIAVTFVDGYGASHAVTTTAADGTYTVKAPFAQDGDLRLVARSGSVELASSNETRYQFTLAQANGGHSISGADLVVSRGGVTGVVFVDADGDATYDAGEELAGATVSVNGNNVTTDASGVYTISGLQPGSITVTVTANGYNTATRNVALGSGEVSQQNITLTAKQSQVTFALRDQDGPINQIPFTVTPVAGGNARQATSNATAEARLTLAPGTYNVTVDYEVQQAGTLVRYDAMQTITVAFGGNDVRFEVVVTRS